jgi:hypothetical protein
MRLKGRVARFKVGPRAPSSRAACDDHARVSTSAPSRPFEPRTASSSPTRSFSTLGMSIWALKGLAREPRRTARQPQVSTETEKIRAGKNRVIYSLSDVPFAKKRQTKRGQLS